MSSYVEDIFLDPFLGSASEALAAIETHRSSIGFEIEDKYWKAAKMRLSPSLFSNPTVEVERTAR
jgi:DNA modification methylase